MQVASSGNEVPPARIVIAMNLSLTPSLLAISVAESTKSSPVSLNPHFSITRPEAGLSMKKSDHKVRKPLTLKQ